MILSLFSLTTLTALTVLMQGVPAACCLFLGNLPPGLSRNDLCDFVFNNFDCLSIMFKPGYQSYVFLCFEHAAQVKEVLAGQHAWIDTYKLIMSFAHHDLISPPYVALNRSSFKMDVEEMQQQMEAAHRSDYKKDVVEQEERGCMLQAEAQQSFQQREIIESDQVREFFLFTRLQMSHLVIMKQAEDLVMQCAECMLANKFQFAEMMLVLIYEALLDGMAYTNLFPRKQFDEVARRKGLELFFGMEEKMRFHLESMALKEFEIAVLQGQLDVLKSEKKSEQQFAFVGREELQRSKIQCDRLSVMADLRASCLAELQSQQQQTVGTVQMHMAQDTLKPDQHSVLVCIDTSEGQQQQTVGTVQMHRAQDTLRPDQHSELVCIDTSERMQRLLVENEALSIHMELVESMASSLTWLAVFLQKRETIETLLKL